jgi:predicted dienelactone hydrolase
METSVRKKSVGVVASILIGAALLAGCAGARAQTPPVGTAPTLSAEASVDYARPGRYRVAVQEGVWRDSTRQRDVAYLIRYPTELDGPAPIVVFSHGLGGSERGAVYYSEHLASHGFAVVHVRHPGSDAAVWGGQRPTPGSIDVARLREAVSDPRVSIERFRDIPFAIESLRALNQTPGALFGKLDTARVGVSGHSFGAVTTQVAAGQMFQGRFSFPAPGVRAFLAMSPSGARDGDNARAFANVRAPFLFLTGTQDSFGLGGDPAQVLASRRAPFDAIEGPPTYLVTLIGGDHFVFSGRQEMGERQPRDERFHDIIRAVSLAFFSGMLRDDATARTWLDGPGLTSLAAADATVERKAPSR